MQMFSVAPDSPQSDPRALPPFAVRYADQSYSYYDIPKSSVAWAPIHELQMRYMADLYAAQRVAFENDFKVLLGNDHVGHYELQVPTESGSICSVCRIEAERIPMYVP
jgi:hypothetical protein